MAESSVRPIITQTPTLVDRGICSFQKTEMGTIAKIMSVIVVYALTQYEKS